MENVPYEDDKNPWIIVANHISDTDPWRIGGFIHRSIDWLCKAELYSLQLTFLEHLKKRKKWYSIPLSPIIAVFYCGMVRGSRTIPIWDVDEHCRLRNVSNEEAKRMKRANKYAMKRSLDMLLCGGTLGVFPEGKKVGENESKEIRLNVQFIKLAKSVDKKLENGLRVKIIPVRLKRGRVVIFGKPFTIDPDCDPAVKTKEAMDYIYNL